MMTSDHAKVVYASQIEMEASRARQRLLEREQALAHEQAVLAAARETALADAVASAEASFEVCVCVCVCEAFCGAIGSFGVWDPWVCMWEPGSVFRTPGSVCRGLSAAALGPGGCVA